MKNYNPVSPLSMVSNIFKKLVNNWLALFSDFQYGFQSSQSSANLLTVVCDRTSGAFNKAFNRPGATQPVALCIFKAFDRV